MPAGILVMAALASAAGSVLLVRVYVRLTKTPESNVGCIGCFGNYVLFFALLWPMILLTTRLTTTTKIDIDPRQGEQYLESENLPPGTTSDFCYRYSFVGVTELADFQMSKVDFMRWMEANDWKPVRFEHQDVVSMPTGEESTLVSTDAMPVRDHPQRLRVDRGFIHCVFLGGDRTKTYIYDLDTGRAYYSRTTY
ncbi:MAG: hypothetical protein MI757_06045 [Pirellulales bacterium]|nr:hypothetical protein [Pirellulales bacterium]